MDHRPSLARAFDTAEDKQRYVRRLFATIADRYDLITRVLSGGQDARWKRRLITMAGISPGERVLDLASGTGDLAYLAADRGARVVALDVTHRMLVLARAKHRPGQAVACVTGDMGALPLPAAAMDVVTTGYGLRNVPDLPRAIGEMARVLRPGGRLLSLDFERPERPWLRAAYLAFLAGVGGTLGWLLHGDADTYRYIPASIRRYPGAAGVATLLQAGGFTGVRVIPLLGGLMALHVAHRAPTDEPQGH
ncbi:MAG: ubiquinone/menaquinone biosynthesis methyltransferase [Vicinamibacterales bacterium]